MLKKERIRDAEHLQRVRDMDCLGCGDKMQPYSKHKTKDLNEILDALVDSGTVEERSCSGVGRPTKEYRAIT